MRIHRVNEEELEIRVGSKKTNRTITVEIPDGDIAPWDLDSKLSVVGSDTSRVDGVAKVTGRAKYAHDINLPGMLHGVLARSPHPHAVVKSVSVDAARDMPGVQAVLVTKEPGKKVRFAGDDVAAVAAETLDQARDAIEKIEVEYDGDDHHTDFRNAPGAPAMSGGEVTEPWPAGEEIDAALDGAAHRATATYTAEVQTHACLETHGVVADYRDGELEVWASTQATFGVRAGLARALGLDQTKVRVHAEFIGGGFGSKFQPGAEGVAAAQLSREAKAPVKVMLDRHEEHVATGNRPSAIIQIRAGADDDGVITAWDYRSWGGPGYTGRGGSTKLPSYYLENAAVRNKQQDVPTHTGASRPMRAPGWPQGFFASESMLDELAAQCGMDPLEFRLKNDAHELRHEEWATGAERFGWKERFNPEPGRPRDGGDARFLSGAGLASTVWGSMGRGGNRVTCRIHADGTVESRNGAQDIGTGMKTVMAMLTAEELQIPPSSVAVAMGDTNDPPGPASGGSTTTPSLAPTVRHAAHQAKARLADLVATHLETDRENIVFRDGKVGDPDGTMLPFAEACKLIQPGPIEATGQRFDNYGGFMDNVCGCQFAEVEVDTHTGLVRVVHMLAVQDCGLVIAEKLAESQVLGGMIQGISYALHEQRILDHWAGRMLNGDLLHYKVACSSDLPTLDVVMLSVANGKNNVGAAGLGEPPKIPTAAAIANAVANATGARVRSLPMTPDRVLAALARRK